MVLILSSETVVNIPELDASFDKADALPFSASSAYLCLVYTHPDNTRLQLAPSIKSHKAWCQARALLLPRPQAGKMPVSKLIPHFSSCLAAFGF